MIDSRIKHIYIYIYIYSFEKNESLVKANSDLGAHAA